jgi:crossover junction endodeoxyribonuclease RusA
VKSLSFFVPGTPAPGGSKNAFPFKRKDGKIGVRVADAGKKNKLWRTVVSLYAKKAMHDQSKEIFSGPIVVTLSFSLKRSRKGKGRPWPDYRPDVLKLARAVEDALTGIVWHDDAQIVAEIISKSFDEPSGVRINVSER